MKVFITIVFIFTLFVAQAQDSYNSTNATLKRQDDRLESERYYRNKAPNSSSKSSPSILPASSNDWTDGRYAREKANREYRENEKQNIYDMKLKSYNQLSANVPKNYENYDKLYNLATQAGFNYYEATALTAKYKPTEEDINKTPHQVTLNFPNQDSYQGMSQYGRMNGYGVYTWKNGQKYEGYWLNDKMNGQGKITKTNGFYKNGVFQNQQPLSFKYYDPQHNEISYQDYEANREKKIVIETKPAQVIAIARIENIKQASEDFFVENKKKSDVITTASGLQYTILQQGTGPKPQNTNNVKITYKGTSINGIEFDNTADYGGSLEATPEQLIPGMQEALLLMPKGSYYKLFIPANLAYGKKGSSNKIRPDEGIVFVLGLLEIK